MFVICVNVCFLLFFHSASSVTWRKSNVEIRSDAFHVVKAEGERHSLVIKEMRPNNAGSYCVTAVNAAGRVSCSARLYIQSGETRARSAKDSPYTHSGLGLMLEWHIYRHEAKTETSRHMKMTALP